MDPNTAQAGIVQKTREFLQQKQAGAQAPAGQADAVNPTTPVPATSTKGMTNLADALYSKGLIDDQMLRSLKFEAITTGKKVEDIILGKKIINQDQMQQIRAEMFGIGFIDLNSINIKQEVLNRINKDLAIRTKSVVFEENDNRLKVAMADPLDLETVKFLESFAGKKVDAYFASMEAIQRVIDTKYGAQIGQEVDKALEDVGVLDIGRSSQVADLSNSSLGGAPVSKIVNMMLDYAVKHNASDIHVEPKEAKVAVRFRVNGILSEKLSIPISLGPALVSRIKILSDLKIDEHRVPQDGRFPVKSGDIVIDVRVSIMPSMYGEKVVMRLLQEGGSVMGLEQTGLRGSALKVYMDALHRTQGIILITGPTGSGKTLTLASSLSILNKPEVNIVTIEDPVEIRIDGITQVQVNADVGLTFASALRSFLRQDPDIIMVGEIRDKETADLAIQAALVGRLVMATLHTNSAAGALPRLLDMGIQPFLLSSTINVVAAQRLVQRLCDECKQPYEMAPEVMSMLHKTLDGLNGFDFFSYPKAEKYHFDSSTKSAKLYKPVGCPKCGETGYNGRIGIFEAMSMSPKIGQMVMSHLSAVDINRQAIAEGMVSMVQDGFMKALEGLTTIEEVLRVQNT